MNTPVTDITFNGILIQEGDVIAKGVYLGCQANDPSEGSVFVINYMDRNGIYNSRKTNIGEFGFILDSQEKKIEGIIPRNEDWYLFWENSSK